MVKDPVFVSLILKMTSQFKKIKHNQFCLRELNMKANFVSEKDFCVAPEIKLICSIKKNYSISSNLSNTTNEFDKNLKNQESSLLNKIRLFRTESVFDTITFSSEFISAINELMVCFDTGKT